MRAAILDIVTEDEVYIKRKGNGIELFVENPGANITVESDDLLGALSAVLGKNIILSDRQ